MKRMISISLAVVLLITTLLASTLSVSAAATKSQADAATSFTFSNGKMSKEVLRSYLSRAVTHQSLGAFDIDEELRMLKNIGAKFIGRAHHFSWAGNLTAAQIEDQYKKAKEMADKAHAVDPEMILQAGIFEIAYKATVENTKVPAHVLEAFGQKVEDRNFNWSKIVFPAGTKTVDGYDVGIGCWGNDSSGMPDITKTETKMYFYNQICRYIDAGYEAFHMGQAEKMMLYMTAQRSKHWDELLTKARAYAKTHARRGLALFDCHTQNGSGGPKVDNRLVFDAIAAGLCPNETVKEDGVMKCEIKVKGGNYWLSWIGTSAGGEHPLGFNIEESFTIL
ncbi:MAG: hypothetical protein IJD11_03695, partial [Oscillospiraceae bacterium]|nr:hypothetical protein [Oscillospiraceae bacterium]